MRLVILESPYAGDIRNNTIYARACVRDCLLRNESPIASHLLFTQEKILRDEIPEERSLGIRAGLTWIRVADYSVFYTDKHWSPGMMGALHECLKGGYDFRIRSLISRKAITLPATLHEEILDVLEQRKEDSL